MYKIHKFLILLITVILFFLNSCGTTKILVPVTRPAEVNLVKFKTIAIGEITGNNGLDLAEEITSALFNSSRFEVLDRQHLNSLLKEHNLSMSGLVDETTSSKAGKFLGSAALVFGRVLKYDYNEKMDTRNWKDQKGGSHTKYTRKGTAIMEANLQITDLTTGKIVAVKNFHRDKYKQTVEDDKKPSRIEGDQLLRLCRTEIVADFMKMIAPYKEMVKVKLFEDGDMPELEKGINLAKIGQWDKAINYFKQAIENHEQNPAVKIDKAWFNLGVACEYTYQFERAEEAIMKAYEINADKDYAKELKNINRLKREQEKLQEQMQL